MSNHIAEVVTDCELEHDTITHSYNVCHNLRRFLLEKTMILLN